MDPVAATMPPETADQLRKATALVAAASVAFGVCAAFCVVWAGIVLFGLMELSSRLVPVGFALVTSACAAVLATIWAMLRQVTAAGDAD